MGCISMERREQEKKRAQDAYATRVAMLKEAGADDKALGRDPKVRELKAELRKANRRIRSITTTAAHLEKVKADKAAAAAAPVAAPKGKKDAPKEKKEAKPAKAPKAPKKEE